jgi:hypothetical protein
VKKLFPGRHPFLTLSGRSLHRFGYALSVHVFLLSVEWWSIVEVPQVQPTFAKSMPRSTAGSQSLEKLSSVFMMIL